MLNDKREEVKKLWQQRVRVEDLHPWTKANNA